MSELTEVRVFLEELTRRHLRRCGDIVVLDHTGTRTTLRRRATGPASLTPTPTHDLLIVALLEERLDPVGITKSALEYLGLCLE